MAAFALAAVGVGLAAASTYGSYKARQQQNAAMQSQMQAEQEAEKLRKKQMELEAKRRTMEVLRNQQRARSIALTAATNQGAAGGSGLQGGFGQISGQANTQRLSTNQNLEIGRGLFGASASISDARMAYANAGTNLAQWQGIGQLGTSMMSVAPQLSALSKGFGTFGTAAQPQYGGWYNLAQTGGYPFPTPYRA